MPKYGYSLYCEGYDPGDLVKQATQAEEAGFDFLVISDQAEPWPTGQEHAGFAWSILGAVAQATSRIELATMVTCPIIRYHPAIVAQAAATVSVLSNGRFTLGLGDGEQLNESVALQDWPSARIRRKMLREATEIIRRLWTGKRVSFAGKYFQLDDARIFDLPTKPMQLYLSAGGPESAKLAAEIADGICNAEPNNEVIKTYINEGGNKNAVWGQIVTSWAKTKEEGLKNGREALRLATGGRKVQVKPADRLNLAHTTKYMSPEDLDELMPAGPDAKQYARNLKECLSAGFTNLAVAYPGRNTEGYMKFWKQELRPLLP